MGRKALLLDLLKQAHEMEMEFADTLSAEERARTGTLEDWSAKDVISHVAARKALMAGGLAAVSAGTSPIGSVDLDQENAVLFEEHRGESWDETLRLAADTLRVVVAWVKTLGEQELARAAKFFPWQGEQPLWRLIVGSGCLHPIGHMAEFQRTRGDLGRAAEMLGRMARSMVDLDDGAAWQGAVKYSLACHHSLLGAKAEAIRELQESLALNPGLVDWSKQDPDLDAIRCEPGYQAIYES